MIKPEKGNSTKEQEERITLEIHKEKEQLSRNDQNELTSLPKSL